MSAGESDSSTKAEDPKDGPKNDTTSSEISLSSSVSFHIELKGVVYSSKHLQSVCLPGEQHNIETNWKASSEDKSVSAAHRDEVEWLLINLWNGDIPKDYSLETVHDVVLNTLSIKDFPKL